MIFSGLAIVFAAAMIGVTVSTQTKATTDLLLYQVEALADGENSGVNCNCSMFWGDGCKANFYGATCAPNSASDCSSYNGNCN